MDAPAVARRYIDAWNAHDGATVLETFAEGGTYADPATGEFLSGSRIAEYADGLFALLPDVCFDVTATHGVDDTTAVVPWRMRGTAVAPPGGDQGGGPGPSRTVDLPGLDVTAVDGDRGRSVVGYFDQKTMLEQRGTRLVMVPADTSGPFPRGSRPGSAPHSTPRTCA